MYQSKRLLIHIGYHKTGTTWLQHELFCHPDTGLQRIVPHPNSLLVEPRPGEYAVDEAFRYFQPEIDKARENGKVPVLSRERLAGRSRKDGSDFRIIADRLKATFPGARILAVIREQKKVIRSNYTQYLKKGGIHDLHAFVGSQKSKVEYNKNNAFMFDFYRYDQLISYYQQLFGPENLLVLPYEQFVRDPKTFVTQILKFSGANPKEDVLDQLRFRLKRNEAYSEFGLIATKLLNRTIRSDVLFNDASPMFLRRAKSQIDYGINKFGSQLPKSFTQSWSERLNADIAAEVGSYYDESNRRTSKLIGIDLATYGYSIAPAESSMNELRKAS